MIIPRAPVSTAMMNKVLMQIVSVRSVGAEKPSEAQWGRERQTETAGTTRGSLMCDVGEN